ncbi:MAG: LysR family transcriptional regulator [Gammaproteobacteria bacterium]|nr:LysR family transcriptional regulator [Gammaproteobacteria bacterium]
MDTLLSMKVFRQVVESNSFAAAAERLELSPAMVSKHVMALEDRLGSRLLNRTTRRLSLTESGRAYYERCAQILSDLEEAERAVSAASVTPRGKLRVNAVVAFGAKHIAPAICGYSDRYPQVNVELILRDRIIDPIEEGYDLSIRAASTELPPSTLIARPITRLHFVACAAPEYLKKWGSPRHFSEFAQHNCLVAAESPMAGDWLLDTGHDRQRVRVSGSFSSNSGEALRVAALAGNGIVNLPTDLIGEDLAAGRLIPLPAFKPLERKIFAVYPARRHLSAKVRTFVDFLIERFGSDPYWDRWMAEMPNPE